MKGKFFKGIRELCLDCYGSNDANLCAILLPPFPWEAQRIAWTYRQISEKLAHLGLEVINLHYSSTGDSEGETSDFSLKLCEEDTRSLIEASTAGGKMSASFAAAAQHSSGVGRTEAIPEYASCLVHI